MCAQLRWLLLQDEAWRQQQKRLLTAQFRPREVESLAMNAVLPIAAQDVQPNAPLFWVQERELHELKVHSCPARSLASPCCSCGEQDSNLAFWIWVPTVGSWRSAVLPHELGRVEGALHILMAACMRGTAALQAAGFPGFHTLRQLALHRACT